MPWGSSNGAQVQKPKKLGVWTTTSPTLLGNSEWIHQICWVKQGVFPGFGLNKRPQKSTDIYPPYEGCKMDLLKCVKTVVDFLDHWNQQISVMWCDRRHFKCSSFALGYPQIVLERFDFKIFLGSTYMQSMCIYIYYTYLESGISMDDWYKSWRSYNHSPQFYHCIPHVQRWREIFGISFVRNQVATVHGIFSWLVSIVSSFTLPKANQLYTPIIQGCWKRSSIPCWFLGFFREGLGWELRVTTGPVGWWTHPSRLKWGFLYGFCLCLDTEKKMRFHVINI